MVRKQRWFGVASVAGFLADRLACKSDSCWDLQGTGMRIFVGRSNLDPAFRTHRMKGLAWGRGVTVLLFWPSNNSGVEKSPPSRGIGNIRGPKVREELRGRQVRRVNWGPLPFRRIPAHGAPSAGVRRSFRRGTKLIMRTAASGPGTVERTRPERFIFPGTTSSGRRYIASRS